MHGRMTYAQLNDFAQLPEFPTSPSACLWPVPFRLPGPNSMFHVKLASNKASFDRCAPGGYVGKYWSGILGLRPLIVAEPWPASINIH